jgi:DNA-binding NarL/FixJ family response regulator
MISVVVVDDHPVVRAGLIAVLGGVADIRVLAEGSCGQDALRLVDELKPDVLILDLNLPDLDGAQVARQLCRQHNKTSILILTVYREYSSAFELLKCGALGYVLKDEALETLANAVRAVARGENWLSPAIATQVVKRAVGKQPASSGERISTIDSANLTPRELEVLGLLADGLDNQSIAHHLILTTRTIQNHVSNIYGKLGVSNRTEAALFAIRHGLSRAPQED